jgi:hypothetical protein
MSERFRVTLTHESGDPDVNRSFEMSKIQLKAHFPKQIELLASSPCSAVAFSNQKGDGAAIIEKLTS